MNNSEIYVSLDIGTSNVRVIIGEVANGTINIIGVGNTHSEGIRKGAIVDIDETVRSIKRAVEQAERMVGLSIKQVIVGVNGNHVQLQPCHGVVAVSSPDREIGDEDIARVIDAAQVVSIPPEREIIDVIPKQFVVDGLDEINDPRGMIGVRLEMEGTIITGSKTILHNLLRCVERAGLQIADICLQPLASGSVAISKDEKNLGVCLIDIGGGSATVSVFEQGTLQSTSVLPIGGDHITNDIAIGLRVSTEEAERIKVKYGHSFIDEASDEERFSVSAIGSGEKDEFSQYDLAHIIEPRMEEVFELIYKEIMRLGYRDFPSGYVLTGGTVMIPGVLELAKELLQGNVRVAIPDYIGVREPQYTTSVGLIQFAYKNVKIQGKEIAASVADYEATEQPQDQKRSTKNEKEQSRTEEKPKAKSKMKNWFKVFFE
ncbi:MULTISPECIES: cell division protein FtsA [Alkalihalophilus]|uniref:Cell division protein FtsA n=2 Tax=Alkalihalophilus pseudofirmus TaxID=79885 RepID=D3FTC9_ALKPO|nr:MULTISPECIES: cell division protein FtsA [Alkalihalophilus]ADC48197.1 cell-division protein (septum formation) [Alkalihalophilus pseudofirmus OF4]MDV2885365.1 cell division protein FtsA [Alkalihalophilus pseudofirmus]MEC2073015.1 cell division protein FtsA [Alkalihalophilus marmarensis]MED1602197.1 cell division protein FtsA [Alkalihalophilus marmarensis]OLS37391.1 cell division protein FtsA [Alkalihalophilus pseudofirmus]